MSETQTGRRAVREEPPRRALETVRVCGTCYELYEEAASGGRPAPQRCSCRKVEGETTWPGYDYNEWVRLCDCCGQVGLKSGSRYSTWFCSACRKELDEYHEAVGRVVIPLSRHQLVGGPSPDRLEEAGGAEAWAEAVVSRVQGLQQGIRLIEGAKRRQIGHTLRELDGWGESTAPFRERESFGLVEYLDACSELPEDQREKACEASSSLIHHFLFELIDPEGNPPPDLGARVEAIARAYVAELPASTIQAALAEGPDAVRSMGFAWAFGEGVLQIYPEACRGRSSAIVLMRLAPVVNALTEAVDDRIRLVWGEPSVPRLPEARGEHEIWACTELDGGRHRISPRARHVFSTQTGGCGTTCQQTYYLTRSADQREWRLWCGTDDECSGREVYYPVAGCRRKGVSMADAGCLLTEATLEAMRDAWDEDAPTVCGTGLVTSDQLSAIVSRLWPDD